METLQGHDWTLVLFAIPHIKESIIASLTPSDILHCILVSRSWMTEFYSFLWRSLQTSEMISLCGLEAGGEDRDYSIDQDRQSLQPMPEHRLQQRQRRLHSRHEERGGGGGEGGGLGQRRRMRMRRDIFWTPLKLCVLQLNCHLIQTLHVTGINTLELLVEGGLCLNLRELYYRVDVSTTFARTIATTTIVTTGSASATPTISTPVVSSTSFPNTSMGEDGRQQYMSCLGLESVMKMVRLNAKLSFLSIANICVQNGTDLESLEGLIRLLEDRESIRTVSLHTRELMDDESDEDRMMEDDEDRMVEDGVDDIDDRDEEDSEDNSSLVDSDMATAASAMAIPLNLVLDWTVRLMKIKTQLILKFPCGPSGVLPSWLIDREQILVQDLASNNVLSPHLLMAKILQEHQQQPQGLTEQSRLQVQDLDLCLTYRNNDEDILGAGASSSLSSSLQNSTMLHQAVFPAFSSLFQCVPRLRLQITDAETRERPSWLQSRFSHQGHWNIDGTMDDRTFATLLKTCDQPLRHLGISTAASRNMAGPWSHILGHQSLEQLLLRHSESLEYLEVRHASSIINSIGDGNNSTVFNTGLSYLPLLKSCSNLKELHILGGCWTTTTQELERHLVIDPRVWACQGLRALTIPVVHESHAMEGLRITDNGPDDPGDKDNLFVLQESEARERAWSGHQVLYDQLNRTFTRLEYLSITTLDSSPSFSCSCASTPLSSLCHYSSMSPSTSQSSLSSLSSYQELALTQDREPTPPLWSWNDMVE